MRYLILIRAPSPDARCPALQARLAAFADALAADGALLDAAVLRDAPILAADTGRSRLGDGPLAGYTLIQARTPDEAREWGRRLAATAGIRLEIWPVLEPGATAPATSVRRS